MKKLIISILCIINSVVYAESNITNNMNTSNEQSQVQDSQSTANTNNNIDYSQQSQSYGSDLSRGVGVGIAPSLTSGLNTCLGSMSVGAGWSGFGVGAGKTYEDRPCNRRNDAMTMARMGSVAVAREVMCESLYVFKASIRAGKPCFPEEVYMEKLTDSELNYYNTLTAQNSHTISETELNSQKIEQLESNFDAMDDRVDEKLYRVHRKNMQK